MIIDQRRCKTTKYFTRTVCCAWSEQFYIYIHRMRCRTNSKWMQRNDEKNWFSTIFQTNVFHGYLVTISRLFRFETFCVCSNGERVKNDLKRVRSSSLSCVNWATKKGHNLWWLMISTNYIEFKWWSQGCATSCCSAVAFRWKLANLIGDLFRYSVSQLKNYKIVN